MGSLLIKSGALHMNYPLRASRMHCQRSSTFWGGEGYREMILLKRNPFRLLSEHWC